MPIAFTLNPASSQGMASLTIGEVAARAGTSTSRIRYYERVGVLPKPPRRSGQRRYDEDVLHRLGIVDVAQRAGLTLDEIRRLTGPENRGEHIRALAERKLPEVEALIARAEAVKQWLELARSCDCRTVDVCSLFTDPALAPPECPEWESNPH
jgi:MerR family transcriptional regulator, redox-sensitive transcriptional activator SoxR